MIPTVVRASLEARAARVSPGGERFYRTVDALMWLAECERHDEPAPDVEGFEIGGDDHQLRVRMDLISAWGDAGGSQAMGSARDLLAGATASHGRELVWSLLF